MYPSAFIVLSSYLLHRVVFLDLKSVTPSLLMKDFSVITAFINKDKIVIFHVTIETNRHEIDTFQP